MSVGPRPSIKLRKAVAVGEQLRDWILRHRSIPFDEEQSMVDDVDHFVVRAAQLHDAHDKGGGIGVVSLRGASIQSLAGSLIELSGWQSERSASHALSLDVFRTISADLDSQELGALVRYRLAGSATAPSGFPVRLELLGVLEVAEIIALAYFGYVPSQQRPMPTIEQVRRLEPASDRRPSASGVRGGREGLSLTSLQILGLRERLKSHFIDAPELQQLSALGFWEELAALIEAGESQTALELLPLLWGTDTELTWLFNTLLEVCEETKHRSELYCPIEAIATRSGETGWLLPHRDSVLARRTVAGLGERAEPIRVARGRSEVVFLERPKLAALVSELVIDLPSSNASVVPPHIAELPALDPYDAVPLEWNDATRLPRARSIDFYCRAKVTFLQKRAFRRGDVTGLIVATDADTPNPPGLPDGISDWIWSTQGDTPQQRARRSSTLFVIARAKSADNQVLSDRYSREFRDFSANVLADLFSDRPQAAEEWTPSRPFSNIHVLAPAPYAEGGTPGGPQPSLLRARTGAEPLEFADGSEFHRSLLRLLEPGTITMEKARQATDETTRLRRELRNRLSRFAPDLSTEGIDARRQIGSLVLHHARACSAAGAISRLQGALLPASAALQGVVSRLSYAAREESAGSGRQALLARAGIAAWLSELRLRARSRGYERKSGMPIDAFAHLIDEIATACVRLDLSGALAATLADTSEGGVRGLAEGNARLIELFIGRFVETLRLPLTPSGSQEPRGSNLRADNTPRLAQASNAREPVRSIGFGDRWCDQLALMLDSNLSTQQRRGTLRGGDELSHLLVELSQASFEVGL